MARIVSILFVFVFCNFVWVFFRAETFKDACYVLGHVLDGIEYPKTYFINNIGLDRITFFRIFLCIFMLIIYDFFSLKYNVILWLAERNGIVRWAIYTILVVAVVILVPASNETGFLYFQF